jgi:hypothetical protein
MSLFVTKRVYARLEIFFIRVFAQTENAERALRRQIGLCKHPWFYEVITSSPTSTVRVSMFGVTSTYQYKLRLPLFPRYTRTVSAPDMVTVFDQVRVLSTHPDLEVSVLVTVTCTISEVTEPSSGKLPTNTAVAVTFDPASVGDGNAISATNNRTATVRNALLTIFPFRKRFSSCESNKTTIMNTLII